MTLIHSSFSFAPFCVFIHANKSLQLSYDFIAI